MVGLDAAAGDDEIGSLAQRLGGIQSNHCRATAYAAARLSLKCCLLLRGNEAGEPKKGNYFLDKLVGADMVIADPQSFTATRTNSWRRLPRPTVRRAIVLYHPNGREQRHRHLRLYPLHGGDSRAGK